MAVDNYNDDVYERPTGQGSSASTYHPSLDINTTLVGFDSEYLYYRINLRSGTDPSGNPGLTHFYGFEINFDGDNKGDLFVRVDDPTNKVGTTFGNVGVIAFYDQNNNVGGANPTGPNGPGQAGSGYEFLAFDQGTNNAPGRSGINDDARARVVSGSPRSVELTVRRAFFTALNGGVQPTKAAFRGHAGKGNVNPGQMYFHDDRGRGDAGSPYPWLQLSGAPASCPNTLAAENALSTAQRNALNSGTGFATAFLNPCYPASGVYEYDISGQLSQLAAGVDLFFVADISGTVFEDVNYGGGAGRSVAASSGVVRSGARVELYSASGSFIAAATTNASGVYTFIGQPTQATYTVRVVNATVTSSRPGFIAGLLPVQTFRTNGLSGTAGSADVARVGGERPDLIDAANGVAGTTMNTATGAFTAGITGQTESIATFAVGNVAAITGIDFGYNFDTIVSIRDSGQGSLRQFIINSNALTNAGLAQAGLTAGRETSLFMIPDGLARPGLRAGLINQFSGGTATITLATALPTISGANTAIDGTRQTAITGDTNAAVAESTTGPEITINAAAGPGLQTTAATTLFDSLGITGANGVGVGVYFNGAATAGSILRNSTVFSNDNAGISLQNGATGVQVQNNISRNNGVNDTNADGIELIGASNNTLSGNQILNNPGYGIDLSTTTNDGNTITSNLIKNNGISAADQDAGIGLRLGSNNTISLNTITANQGDGIVINSGTGNRITQNSIFANGNLGIDLGPGNSGNGVTLNDAADLDSGANNLQNYPVLSGATISAGNLTIIGFARAGSVIELFIAATDLTGFGEGQTYLVTLSEGSGGDADSTTGTYGPGPVNGIAQGTDATNRFSFTIPVPGGVTAGSVLTATAALANSTSEFSGNVTVAASNLPLTIVKSSQTFSDPFNGATNPKAIPGAFVAYTIIVSTPATTTVDGNTVIITDAIPANTDLFVGDVGAAGSGPVAFTNGVPSSGLTYTFTSLASGADDVSFSNDDGATFVFTPTADVDGADSAVTHIRINPKGTFNGGSNFQVAFRVRVE